MGVWDSPTGFWVLVEVWDFLLGPHTLLLNCPHPWFFHLGVSLLIRFFITFSGYNVTHTAAHYVCRMYWVHIRLANVIRLDLIRNLCIIQPVWMEAFENNVLQVK